MNFYYVLFIIGSAFSLFEILPINKKKAMSILYIIMVGVLLLFSINRSITSAVDLPQYQWGFGYIKQHDIVTSIKVLGWEPGYIIYSKLIALLNFDFHQFLMITSVFVFLPIFTKFYQYSLLPCFSLVIFLGLGYYNAGNGILRIWMAISILSLSYRYILNRDVKKFLIVIVVAAFFHRTAVAFIPAYFIATRMLTNNMILISVFFSLLLGVFSKPIIVFLEKFARNTYDYGYYGGVNMMILLVICSLLASYIFKKQINFKFTSSLSKKLIKKNNIAIINRMFLNFLLFAMVIQPIAFVYSNWARIVDFYAMSFVIVIPNMIKEIADMSIENKKAILIVECFIIVLLYIMYWNSDICVYSVWGM